jgi:hypothetical protein
MRATKIEKARPAAGSGGDVYMVAQNSDRLAHDEESDAQAVTSCGIKAGESVEDLRYLFARNSDTRVVHIDPDTRTRVPAAKKDAPSWLAVLDRIADQIAQGGAKEQAIAQDRGVAGNRVDAYTLSQRRLFVLAASLPQDLMNAYRPELETPRAFSDAQRSQDLLQLLLKSVDRILTGPQIAQLGTRSDPKPQEFVSALNRLEWLAEIVPRHGKQHCLEIRDPVRLGSGRHAPSCRSRGDAGCAKILVAFRRLNMIPHLAHVRSLQMAAPMNPIAWASVARFSVQGELNVLRCC